MAKILTKEKLKEMILDVAELEYRYMSIREIATQLYERYGIKKSPQTIKNLLKELEKEGKLEKE